MREAGRGGRVSCADDAHQTRTAKLRGPVPSTPGSSRSRCDFGLAAETQKSIGDGD